MKLRNRCRLQLEELERRETPSAPFMPVGPPDFPHNPGFPVGPPDEPAGQTANHPAPIPLATGTYLATVTLNEVTFPQGPPQSQIVVPVTIDFQAGAHFETVIAAGGLQVVLKGELNQAQGTVHFDCTIWSNGEKIGTATGEGTFVDPTGPNWRGQIDSFAVNFTFTMADGTTGSGTAVIEKGTPPT
jgi:hypothetical protein